MLVIGGRQRAESLRRILIVSGFAGSPPSGARRFEGGMTVLVPQRCCPKRTNHQIFQPSRSVLLPDFFQSCVPPRLPCVFKPFELGFGLGHEFLSIEFGAHRQGPISRRSSRQSVVAIIKKGHASRAHALRYGIAGHCNNAGQRRLCSLNINPLQGADWRQRNGVFLPAGGTGAGHG
jgi:hypothetical protein